MERIVIVGYKPLNGKEKELKELSKSHWKTLHRLGLVTDREPILMEAENGTVIEIFGWISKQAMEQAHSNPKVLKMWGEYSKICEYVPIGKIKETESLFSEFTPINPD
ncbi:hypothetical protein [Aquimarina rubra]|uniref:YCII-related domain-containing protein n=1 Tax=Aquimarina rubra TaxID=1920033 RepID=A0ABW5LLN2_9FLAO